jgi:hypothetical protein
MIRVDFSVSRYFIKLCLILTLGTLACGVVSPSSLPPMPVPVQGTVSARTVSTPSLTGEQLKNAQYQLGARDDHAIVQLTDGKYQQGTDATTLDYAHVELTELISIGDLTGDGVNEAAAILFENYGGTGNFAFLAIYSFRNGLPVFLASTMIDDRPKVNSLSIEDGKVFLDATIHSFNDPGCCPALPTTRRYALVNKQLHIVNYTTSTSDGAKRIIEIKSPANGTEVTGSVQVSGTVSITPFENNLSYFIYNEAGEELAKGSVTVIASDLGAPGTFDLTISLEGIPAGAPIYMEVQDINAADGSLFAMDAVKLVVE